MERRFPNIGKFALLISVSQFLGILLNGILGWFPAGIIGTGARGEKFHLLQYLRQSLNLPYKDNGFWSDAGVLTGQEYAMLLLMIGTLVIAVIGLRARPSISGPQKQSIEDQQAQLESGQVSVSRPGGLSVVNPTTAAIVSSIVGKEGAPAAEIIADALGEMTAVALEMGVDDELIKGQIIQESVDDSTIDSRFTTKVGDQEDDIFDLTGTGILTTSIDGDDELGWLDDSDAVEDEPDVLVFDPTSSSDEPTLPELPTVKATTKTVEPISPPTVKAVAPPVVKAVAPPVVEAVATPVVETVAPPPAVEMVSDDSSPNYLKRKEAQFGSMPRRPSGLPKAAVFDIEMNSWTLFGRPVEESKSSTVVSTKPSSSGTSAPAVQTKARKAPALPSIPTSNKKNQNTPRLPNIPQI
ncbi:MAG TPA: hypothetical protein QF802_02590 [Candidatus Thalassarchaeaceae archaeon]|nr:hypothetical protein [Candidatus Thalassarchaeaceae archaeon]